MTTSCLRSRLHELPPEAALDAEIPSRDVVLEGGCRLYDGAVLHVQAQRAPDAAVRVLDTETRTLSAKEAARCVAVAVPTAPARRYFKKIDSTLRGHVGAEIDALMSAIGASSALLTPAFPAQGRTVVDRMLMLEGAPITETGLARDL